MLGCGAKAEPDLAQAPTSGLERQGIKGLTLVGDERHSCEFPPTFSHDYSTNDESRVSKWTQQHSMFTCMPHWFALQLRNSYLFLSQIIPNIRKNCIQHVCMFNDEIKNLLFIASQTIHSKRNATVNETTFAFNIYFHN